MAKAAFANWNDRIAPVFDVSRSILVVESEAGQIVSERQFDVTDDTANLKTACLLALEIETLVCGAISRPLQRMLSAYGIEVIGFVAGNLKEIIQAWACGELACSDTFAMPGCSRKSRHPIQGADNTNGGLQKMDSRRGRKMSAGQGAGPGRKGRKGQGRGQGSRTSGTGPGATPDQGACICPLCGQTAPHVRGVPCSQKICPGCGALMSRQ